VALLALRPTEAAGSRVIASATLVFPCAHLLAETPARFTIRERPTPLTITKSVLAPAGDIHVGDLVRFDVTIQNTGPAALSVIVDDTFLNAEFGYEGPMWLSLTTDGIRTSIAFGPIELAPGATAHLTVPLRAGVAGRGLQDCAAVRVETLTAPRVAEACAAIDVLPAQGDAGARAVKSLTAPTTHVTRVGDWIQWWMWVYNERSLEAHATAHDYVSDPRCVDPGDDSRAWLPSLATSWRFGRVDRAVTPCRPLINHIDWAVAWPDGQRATVSASDYVYILGPNDNPGSLLVVKKELIEPAGEATVGDTVRFRVTVTNPTGMTFETVPLDDAFDNPCLRFLAATLPSNSVSAAGSTTFLHWDNIGPLGPGASVVIELTFTAIGTCPETKNCAEVRYAAGAENATQAACVLVPIRGAAPALELRKTRLSTSPAAPGDVVTWQIAVTNTGSVPIDTVPLVDWYAPADFEFVAAVPAPDHTYPDGSLTWNNLGALLPGQSRSVSLQLKALRPGVGLENCAGTSLQVGTTVIKRTDCATVDVLVRDGPAIRVDKRRVWPAEGVPLAVGDLLRYRIVAVNVGSVPLSALRIYDSFSPSCLRYVAIQPDSLATHFTALGGAYWDLSDLGVGMSATIEVTLQAAGACASAQNCALATAKAPDGTTVQDQMCVTDGIVEDELAIRVTKRLAAPERLPLAGDTLRFEIVVQNTGTAALLHVPVTDTFDLGCWEFVGTLPAADGLNLAAGQVWWNDVGPLLPGEAKVLSVFMRARQACQQKRNCALAVGVDGRGHEVAQQACTDVMIAGGREHVWLPLILRRR